jgi:hypothetical protein
MSVSIIVQVQFNYLICCLFFLFLLFVHIIYYYLFIIIQVSYTTLTVNSRNYCFQCDSSCLTCKGSSSSQCISCVAGRYLSFGYCLTCSPSCLTCSTSSTNCTSCSNILLNNKCYNTCPDGYFAITTNTVTSCQ